MLPFDRPIGRPSFRLSTDQISTAVDLLCAGVDDARSFVTAGMLEVPLTVLVRKSMRRLKGASGLTNMEVGGEHELLDILTTDPSVVGRIDIVFRFAHQFGDESAYLGVECKRVAPGNASLNNRYISEGVERFVSGKYATGHHLGIMLAYVLQLPLLNLVEFIDNKIQQTYGQGARCTNETASVGALATLSNQLLQSPNAHRIRLLHIFVDMTAASQ